LSLWKTKFKKNKTKHTKPKKQPQKPHPKTRKEKKQWVTGKRESASVLRGNPGSLLGTLKKC